MERQDIDCYQNITNKDSEHFMQELFNFEQKKPSAFMAKSLIIATMPHSDPKVTEFQRVNGNFKLVIFAQKDIGIPYGPYPRYVLLWLCTKIVKTGNRKIFLGHDFTDFMRQLDYAKGGGPRGVHTSMRIQMRKLFNAVLAIHSYEQEKLRLTTGFRVSSKVIYYWDNTPGLPESSWESEVTLTEDLYNEIVSCKVPVDLETVKALRRSSLAMDIYMWLTYRVSYLKEPIIFTWQMLWMQFGSEHKCVQDFKKNFLIQLKKVLSLYPVKISSVYNGVLLGPSRTHVLVHTK